MKYVKKIVSKIQYIITICLLLINMVPSVNAEEIIIVSNGSGTDNIIDVSSSQSTIISQNNSADISNNTSLNSSTGGNDISGNNSHNNSIDTGNSDSKSEIENSLNHTSVNLAQCNCESVNTIKIANNGAGSVNSAYKDSSISSNISINQSVKINNFVSNRANTGRNSINNNSGGNYIRTGNINSVYGSRSLVNTSEVINSQNIINGFGVIKDNGVNSINSLNLRFRQNSNLLINNYLDFLNIIDNELNSGDNQAASNNGNSAIYTGDIWSRITITNLANVSKVHVDCNCQNGEAPPIIPPGITNPPVNGGGNNESNHGSQTVSNDDNHNSSNSIAQIIGELLPATGGNWLINIMIGNGALFMLGVFLRFKLNKSSVFDFILH